MDIKRKTIEDFKKQIDEGKFASNNELVTAIRDLYNNSRMLANGNPLLEQFLSENDYTAFTKEITSELVEYYKQYKEQEKPAIDNLSDIQVEGQKIDQGEISQVNTGDITYYTVKEGANDYSVYAASDNSLINDINAAMVDSEEDITHVAKEIIEEKKVEVDLTGLEVFERERNLSLEDHKQAALARSMQTYTGDQMAVNAEHDVILNTDSGELSKVDETGKVMTYDGSSLDGPSMVNGEQFTLSNDVLDTLSVEDIDMMINDPEKYKLSPETIEALKVAKSSKVIETPTQEKEMEIGFQKVLKPPTNFRTSAFIDVLLVALVCLGFSSIVLLRLLLTVGL